MTENYFVNYETINSNSLLTFEFRFILKNVTVNTGLIVELGPNSEFYTPIVGISVPIIPFAEKMR